MSCEAELEEALKLAQTLGIASFSALALLVAFIAGFVELSRDRVVVSRSDYRWLRAGSFVLTAEVVTWLALELGTRGDWPVEFCSQGGLIWLQRLLLVGLLASTLMFWQFIQQLVTLVSSAYQK